LRTGKVCLPVTASLTWPQFLSRDNFRDPSDGAEPDWAAALADTGAKLAGSMTDNPSAGLTLWFPRDAAV